MRWIIFLIIGSLFLSLGIILIVLAPSIPVYYAGGGTAIAFDGTVVHGVAPSRCEIVVPMVPNTLHIRVRSGQTLIVQVTPPKGAIIIWQNKTVYEDYTMSESGLWMVHIVGSGSHLVLGEVYVTAPPFAHPALIYASGPIVLGLLSLLYSKNKRKLGSQLKCILFKQNIGGRWVFGVWIPIFVFMADAPKLIPSYPWLYALLIMITVIAVLSSIALAYVKLYVSTSGVIIEAPFLNFSKHYETNEIYGYAITKEKKQRWFFLWRISLPREEKEHQVALSLLEPLPKRL